MASSVVCARTQCVCAYVHLVCAYVLQVGTEGSVPETSFGRFQSSHPHICTYVLL